MRSVYLGSCLTLLLVACGGGSDTGGDGQPCGPNGECDTGLVCDPTTNTCVHRGVYPGPPVVVISSPAEGSINCPITIVTFDTSPADDTVTYTCQLDGAAASPCSEPSVTFQGLALGPHTVRIHAVDESSNATDEDVSFTVIAGEAPPEIDVGAVTPGQDNSGSATIAVAGSVGNAVAAIALAGSDGGAAVVPCDCTVALCTCTGLAAGENTVTVAGTNACGTPGTALVVSVNASFGPNDGHIALIGDRFDTNSTPSEILVNAVTLAPVRHRNLSERPLRVLAFTGRISVDDAGRAGALDALGTLSGFDAQNPVHYDQSSDPDNIPALLPGRDVLLVYDQGFAYDTDELFAIADTWHASLAAFLDAGGVVVVLNGVVEGEGVSSSDTFRILAGTQPLLATGADAVGRGSEDIEVVAVYPAELLGTPPFWLAKDNSGGWEPADADSCFFLPPEETATPVFNYVAQFCDDGCNFDICPVVVDKVFPPLSMTMAFDLPPNTSLPDTTGTVGTGSFTFPDVARTGFTCSFDEFPNGDSLPASQACSVPAEGSFSFDTVAGDASFNGHITLLDRTGEPALSVSRPWHVVGSLFVGATTPAVNASSVVYEVCAFGDQGCAPFQSVTCTLLRDGGSGFIEVATRTNAGCGATPNGAGWNNGTITASFAADIDSVGTYRATFVAGDFYGNSATATVEWIVND